MRASRARVALAVAIASLAGLLGGVLAALATRPESAPASFKPPATAPPAFRLRDHEGRWARPVDARGDVLVVTFLFASCRSLCPSQAADIRDAVAAVGAKDLQVYAISVDPVGDTPERARRFLARNGLARAPVRYLLGTRQELEPVWRAYGIVPITAAPEDAVAAAESYSPDLERPTVRGRPLPAPAEPPPTALEPFPSSEDLQYRGRVRHGFHTFEHSAYALLVDRRGRQRVGLPFEQMQPEHLAEDLRILLAEKTG